MHNIIASSLLLFLLLFTSPSQAFVVAKSALRTPLLRSIITSGRIMSSTSGDASASMDGMHPFCCLPGDPSLLLTTNIDLGDKKLEIMKACSKAIAQHTGKPESYVGVSIADKASVIFGGTDAPCALGCLYSIGAIATASNGKITAAVTDLLAEFGLEDNRIYINFFDVPRGNVGWSRATFAG